MSEYQYYEFAAIDRPLKPAEMAKLRAVSTRAEITPVSFVNHYEWGDLKASPADWMQRYFDAFVYTANWCSRYLSLRVPLETFSRGALKPFATRYALTCKATKTYWIINWALDESEDYDRFAIDDGRHWMRRLVHVGVDLEKLHQRDLSRRQRSEAGRDFRLRLGVLELVKARHKPLNVRSDPVMPPG